MQKIGWDLAHTIMEVQQQKISVHDKRNFVKMDCRLAVLCLNTFSLKTVLKMKVAQDVGYIVDFMAINKEELMYLESGTPIFIRERNFRHFHQANIFIDLTNVTSHLIFIQSEIERKLTNKGNGTCLCKSSKSLSNLQHKQILIERKLKKLVYNFVEITAAMQMIFPAVLHSCLNAYKIGDMCTLHDLRKKRSIFSSDNSHDEIKKVTHVFNRISKRY